MNLLVVSRITDILNPTDPISTRITSHQNPTNSISRISYHQNPNSYDYSGNLGCQVSKEGYKIIVFCNELSESAKI